MAESYDPADVSRAPVDFMAASPYAHLAYDLDLIVLDINWRHEQMTGVARDRVVGRYIYDAFPHNPDDPNGSSEPAVRASIARMVASQEPDTMEPLKHDLLAPDGGFQERYWQVTHSPIYDGANGTGTIVGALQTTRDITADILRLRVTAAQHRAAMVGGQVVLFEMDLETDRIEAPSGFDFLHGMTPQDDRQPLAAYYERIHREDRKQTIALVDRLREAPDGTEGRTDYRIVRPDGTIRWLSASMEVVRGTEGEAARLTGVLIDVTDLHETESNLREALAQRDLLIEEVNHRVKNSLQLVISVLALEAKAARGEEARESLQSAIARIHAISTIHASLYEDGDVSYVALDRYLRRFCRHLETSLGADRRRIALNVDAEEIRLPTSKAITLSLVVNELVTNAFKHAFRDNQPGRIDIVLRQAGNDRVVLEIADNGSGEDAASSEGTGLGTRLIAGSVNQLGGTIRQSSDDGGWTTRIEFPAK
ncbi:MAG: histidine kinase dimerization/phosphoacceptor domain -containing protein [Pacificimonas sp.]|nr:histidine kinase dimerization/phosphoacceptor domain -containing protein [Pacificimonas sp.]